MNTLLATTHWRPHEVLGQGWRVLGWILGTVVRVCGICHTGNWSILVAGPLVAWIVAGLEGAVVVGGVSAVGAGLVSIGIPKDSVLKYDVALKTDKFLLVIHGTPDAVDKAKDIIAGTEHSYYSVHGEAVLAGR